VILSIKNDIDIIHVGHVAIAPREVTTTSLNRVRTAWDLQIQEIEYCYTKRSSLMMMMILVWNVVLLSCANNYPALVLAWGLGGSPQGI